METAFTKIPKWERPRSVPQSEGALAKAGKIARGQTTQSLGGCAVKFAFYSKYHRKSLKLLNKNCQRNKTHYVCNSLHLYFKENVCWVVLRQEMDSLRTLREVLYLCQDYRWSGIDPWPQQWVIQYLPFQKRYSIQHKSKNKNWKEYTIHTLPRDIYIFIPWLEYILSTLNIFYFNNFRIYFPLPYCNWLIKDIYGKCFRSSLIKINFFKTLRLKVKLLYNYVLFYKHSAKTNHN